MSMSLFGEVADMLFKFSKAQVVLNATLFHLCDESKIAKLKIAKSRMVVA